MRKVLYITGTRADYGLMRSTLKEIDSREDLELMVVVTGMHLMPEFGNTVDEVRKDGFQTVIVPASFEGDSRAATPRFLGTFIRRLTDVVEKERPDEILLLGDRAEMLAGAIVGSYMGIPTFHVHGGDISSTVDEHVRHAITKLSHYHLAATETSAERIRRMGEEGWRVRTVGSPSLDEVCATGRASDEELRSYGLDPGRQFLLVVQHPVSEDSDRAAEQMRGTIEALDEYGLPSVVVYPNADAGGRAMIEVIEKHCRPPRFVCFRSLPRDDYLKLMTRAKALVGNTSSGLVEAPSFRTPFVNVGERQRGRERGSNVIDVGYGRKDILNGLRYLDDARFQDALRSVRNPYGDGRTGTRIAQTLADADLTRRVVQKKLDYDI